MNFRRWHPPVSVLVHYEWSRSDLSTGMTVRLADVAAMNNNNNNNNIHICIAPYGRNFRGAEMKRLKWSHECLHSFTVASAELTSSAMSAGVENRPFKLTRECTHQGMIVEGCDCYKAHHSNSPLIKHWCIQYTHIATANTVPYEPWGCKNRPKQLPDWSSCKAVKHGFSFLPSPPKALCFRSVCPPRSFIRTDLVTTIPHEWLEYSSWNLQEIFNSPYLWRDYMLEVKGQGHSMPSRWQKCPCHASVL